jgi:hypothetical protein
MIQYLRIRDALLALGLLSGAPLAAQPLPEADLRRVERFFEASRGARYMEENCAAATYPGWDGFPLQRCRYTVRNRDGTRRTGTVILLNGTPRQLARWVVHTCREVKGNTGARCTGRLARHIIGQSGAQFPVAGIVYEDILPSDGRQEAYVFRDGVTVGVRGFEHRMTRPPTAAEVDSALTGTVLRSFRFARIQSTTREQYRANGGTDDVGTDSDRKLRWLRTVREAYQAAWDQDRNELMIAWARANAGQL